LAGNIKISLSRIQEGEFDEKVIKAVTTGNYDVTNLYGYNKVKQLFYYQAAKKSPLQRENCSISLNGKKEAQRSKKEGTLLNI